MPNVNDQDAYVQWILNADQYTLSQFVRKCAMDDAKDALTNYCESTEPAFPYKKRIYSVPSVDINGDEITIREGTEIIVLGRDTVYNNLRLCRLATSTKFSFFLDIGEINYEQP